MPMTRRDLLGATLAASFGHSRRAERSRVSARRSQPPGERIITVVAAPCNLGLRPPAPGREPGVRKLAQTLIGNGLATDVGATEIVPVDAPAYVFQQTPGDGVYNAPAIFDYSHQLADAVGTVLDRGHFPLVLGGDCSILLGNLLALHRRGRYGLVYLDAHSDTDLPSATHLTAGAGSDVAVATGYGVTHLRDLAGGAPLVRVEDAVLVGYVEYGPVPGAPWTTIPLAEFRREGIATAVARVLERFRRQGVAGFWIHLDADVLDDALMSAVDSRHADGLSWTELDATLRDLLASPLAAGMEVTIYDPERDPTGAMGRKLTSVLAGAIVAR